MKIYDFTNQKGRSVIQEWVDDIRLSKKMRGRFDSKVDLLATAGPEVAPKLLSGTRSGHIKKLKVKGDVQLRPHLCLGPIDNETECTFLVGAVERDYKLIPEDVLVQAEASRTILINANLAKSPLRRIQYEPLSR